MFKKKLWLQSYSMPKPIHGTAHYNRRLAGRVSVVDDCTAERLDRAHQHLARGKQGLRVAFAIPQSPLSLQGIMWLRFYLLIRSFNICRYSLIYSVDVHTARDHRQITKLWQRNSLTALHGVPPFVMAPRTGGVAWHSVTHHKAALYVFARDVFRSHKSSWRKAVF